MLFYVLNALCILMIVGVHEFGHYYAARQFGIVPPNFSIGLGPELFGRTFGGTRFSFRPIPLGGYVGFDPKSIESLSFWRQVGVFLSGPLANLLLCIVLVVCMVLCGIVPESMQQVSTLRLLMFAIPGTVGLFVISVPLTVWSFVLIILHPVASVDLVSGPISIYSGTAVPQAFLASFSLPGKMVMISYLVSLGLGSFNLTPISMLDGGRILRLALSRWPRVADGWLYASTGFLLLLVVYMCGADVVKLFC